MAQDFVHSKGGSSAHCLRQANAKHGVGAGEEDRSKLQEPHSEMVQDFVHQLSAGRLRNGSLLLQPRLCRNLGVGAAHPACCRRGLSEEALFECEWGRGLGQLEINFSVLHVMILPPPSPRLLFYMEWTSNLGCALERAINGMFSSCGKAADFARPAATRCSPSSVMMKG